MDRFCEDIYNCERYISMNGSRYRVLIFCADLFDAKNLKFSSERIRRCAKVYICYARLIILLCKLFYLKES